MRQRNGFVLIFTCVALVLLMAIAGVAVDVGRMHIGRNELQSFAESAAMAGALQLDGTPAGIERAAEAVKSAASGPDAMRWDMATKSVDGITTYFAQPQTANADQPDPGSWTDHVNSPSNYRFVKVIAAAEVPSFFMRAFEAVKDGTTKIVGVGVAGQVASNGTNATVTFSPAAANAVPPDWGFKEGERYSIRYLPPGDEPLNDEAAATLVTRVREDSDAISTNYASYASNGKGNGRRLVSLPVNKGDAAAFTSLGYAQFFLLTPDAYNTARNNEPLYAEYVGPAASGSFNNTSVRLIR